MALEKLLDLTSMPPLPQHLYEEIVFPEPPADRPYVFINMAATVDGKIVLGEPGSTAKGVGGPTDQLLFRRLQRGCDAAMIGSGTLRASQVIYPSSIQRYVVTASGDIPLDNRFFTDAPNKAFVIAPEAVAPDKAASIGMAAGLIRAGKERVDLAGALRVLRTEKSVRLLLCEGGAALNDEMIRAGLVDELFLTIAPKLKGGDRRPTILAGLGLPLSAFVSVTLVSIYRDGDELYLRYKIGNMFSV